MLSSVWQRLSRRLFLLAPFLFRGRPEIMILHRRSFLASTALLSTAGCVSTVPPAAVLAPPLLPGAPLNISNHRVTRITVCTRPFRPAGPRIEAEAFGEKTVIHNYGHGGSGWSLSWGCAEDVADLVSQTQARDIAIIGAGVMGLTSAVRLAQTGANVTIYAKDLPSESRSSRATGVWSPSSRIGLTSAVASDFDATWDRWARKSYSVHQSYVGSLGRPVEYVPFYQLRSGGGRGTPASRDFLHWDGRLDDLFAPGQTLSGDALAFPVTAARRFTDMAFNVAVYTERLLRDFYAFGGRMIRQTFDDRAQVLALDAPVIVNCTGYGAKTLWGADELAPVRGQINWLPAQPEARYGVFYKSVYVLSRGDGLVLQYVGENDDYGYGIEDETPDPEEMRRAVETIAPLFSEWA
ncbi:MAG: FAD-dependent oxidoreductase [Pseudomonadota bacterium]